MYTNFANIAASTTVLMTSQIRSCMKYLLPTYNIHVLLLHSNFMKHLTSLITRQWLTFWATLKVRIVIISNTTNNIDSVTPSTKRHPHIYNNCQTALCFHIS